MGDRLFSRCSRFRGRYDLHGRSALSRAQQTAASPRARGGRCRLLHFPCGHVCRNSIRHSRPADGRHGDRAHPVAFDSDRPDGKATNGTLPPGSIVVAGKCDYGWDQVEAGGKTTGWVDAKQGIPSIAPFVHHSHQRRKDGDLKTSPVWRYRPAGEPEVTRAVAVSAISGRYRLRRPRVWYTLRAAG